MRAAMMSAIVLCAGSKIAAEQAGRPNILVIVSDDQRPDTIAALGNPIIKTPHLDRLVREGSVFTRAICANPICTPSRAEILTGCSGFTNGVVDFGGKFKAGIPRWAGVLKAAGYETWYVGKWHNKGKPVDHGYARTRGLYTGGGGKGGLKKDHNGRPITGYRGWVFRDRDHKPLRDRGVGLTKTISRDFADAAIDAIDTKRDKPFFLHVNFTAPHDPLLMPPGYEKMYPPNKIPVPPSFRPRHPFDHGNFNGRDERLFEWPRTRRMVQDELAVYYAVISHMDAQIGRILKSLEQTRQMKNTIVVFTSDHGLAIGSHGLRGKQSMYEHTIGVPLILAGPGIPKGKKFSAQCYLRDLFPTTCALADVRVPATVEGRSLVPVLKGQKQEIYREVFGYFRSFQRMIRTQEWKLISYPQVKKEQLFHLKTDPHERTNLIHSRKHAAIANRLRKRLADRFKTEVPDRKGSR